MHLFVIYIGGATKTSLIELHDMRFCVAETIEETYAALKASWWGTPESLHLDCWGILKSVEGYEIQLRPTPAQSEQQLYFVNLGGYNPAEFTEYHQNVFVVARNAAEAKQQALLRVSDWETPHRDYLTEVEQVFCVQDLMTSKDLHIHLIPTEHPEPFQFICRYIPIGKTTF